MKYVKFLGVGALIYYFSAIFITGEASNLHCICVKNASIKSDNTENTSETSSKLGRSGDLPLPLGCNYNVPNLYYEWTEDFEGDVSDWTTVDLTYVPSTPTWHPDTFKAYGGSGKSWWVGDPAIKGYRDSWYQVLESPEIILPSTGLTLTFMMNRNVEDTAGASGETGGKYNGWDGCNVRISTDGGVNWTVLTNPTPAYNSTSMFSFGYEHMEGQGVPGWGGSSGGWVNVSFDISAYAEDTVKIRWAFASDPAYCTVDNGQLFGWQIDSIDVAGVFTNNGEDTTGFICKCIECAHGDFWNLTEESFHSATHSFNCGEDKPRALRNALVSPPITLPNETSIPFTYWVYCDMPDADGDGNNRLEDFYAIDISRDDGTTWENFGYDYGYNGSEAGWVLRETRLVEGRQSPLDLFEYAGATIRIGWWVITDDNDDGGKGTGLYIDDINITVGVEESQIPVPNLALYQNTPNPVISKTTIQFAIDKPCNVSLKIYNLSGQLVRTLVDRQETAGLKSVVWDGTDSNSKRVGTGIYFYELNADNLKRTKKLVLVK